MFKHKFYDNYKRIFRNVLKMYIFFFIKLYCKWQKRRIRFSSKGIRNFEGNVSSVFFRYIQRNSHDRKREF